MSISTRKTTNIAPCGVDTMDYLPHDGRLSSPLLDFTRNGRRSQDAFGILMINYVYTSNTHKSAKMNIVDYSNLFLLYSKRLNECNTFDRLRPRDLNSM